MRLGLDQARHEVRLGFARIALSTPEGRQSLASQLEALIGQPDYEEFRAILVEANAAGFDQLRREVQARASGPRRTSAAPRIILTDVLDA